MWAVPETDETVAEFIKRTVLKIPMTKMMTILKAWDFFSENQLQTVNFPKRKESLAQDLVLLCEENCVSLNEAALVDIIYTQFHQCTTFSIAHLHTHKGMNYFKIKDK
uniref:Centromere protein N n=1 Tax=Rhinolophus ferrumequinum TaxID=59479 RepID=A0A671EB37_RHIFE